MKSWSARGVHEGAALLGCDRPMKSSAEALKTLRGRRRWRGAVERKQSGDPLDLRDYIEVMRTTMQDVDEAVCALDSYGYIQFANTRFQSLLARSEPALIGRSIVEFGSCSLAPCQDANPRQAAMAFQTALRRLVGRDTGACEWRRPDDSRIQSHCSLRPIMHEGRALGLLLTISRAEARETIDQARRAERHLRIIEAVGDVALAHLPVDALLQTLLDSMRREMHLENIAIFLLDDDDDMLRARVASGAGAQIAHTVQMPVGVGVVGEAMRARQPIFISNAQQLEARSTFFTAELRASMNLQSFVVVPLIIEDRAIGAIYAGSDEPYRFTQEDARLVELVGERAALAIERARANEEAERAHERLRFLNDASGALNAILDYRETTQRLAAILTPALADACAVYLLEDDGLLRKVSTLAPSHGLLAPDRVDVALQRIVERLAATIDVSADETGCAIGQSVSTLSPAFEQQPLEIGGSDACGETGTQENEASTLCVAAPLVVRQHALGALYLVARPGRDFTDGDLTLAQGLAERAAVAIDNARLYSETQQALASGSATATQLDTIFDATDVGIVVTDANGQYLRINPYGAHMLGLPPNADERAISSMPPTFELRTPEGDPIAAERDPLRLARVMGRPIEQRVIIHRYEMSKDIQALIRCTPWLDTRNQIAGAICVVTDITTISELERQKDEFLGIASHELKTPLTSLKILAELLGRKMKASGELRDLEQANRMQVAITRMERLINDLLDVSRIDEGKLALNLEVTDLGSICVESAHEQEMLNQRAIQCILPPDADLAVFADRERIYQVMTNLLSNAIKYSPATEAVVVRARVTTDDCIVSVHDHGSGVPPEAIDHVFERFFRVPGMQVQSGSGVGLGLGLSITKDIITRHDGRIWVESKLGHGSTFSFALPRVAAQERRRERA